MSPAPLPLVAVAVATSVSVAAAVVVQVAPTQNLAPVRLPLASSPAAATAATAAPAGGWGWPVSPPEVVRAFDPPSEPWLAGHRGVDLEAPVGAVVASPAPGRVTYASILAGRGVVVVAHADGLRSTLEPVRAAVPVGAAVTAGEAIGTLADEAGHCAPAACLHWGVLRGREYVDPLSLIGTPRVVLLPLG